MLRNPFGVRNGKIVVIAELTAEERGLQCQCTCPSCGGDLVARLGDIKVHHFAHTKDACEIETIYLSSILGLLRDMIHECGRFYVPGLCISYQIPLYGMTADTVEKYTQIVPETQANTDGNRILIASGKQVPVDKVTLETDPKGRPEAAVLSVRQRLFAIRIHLPSICKATTPKPYRNYPTLVFDAENINFYATNISEIRSELKKPSRWIWLANPRVAEAYDSIYMTSQQAQERRRLQREVPRQQEKQRIARHKIKVSHSRSKHAPQQGQSPSLSQADKERKGYLEVKDLFVQQDSPIRDSFGVRWVQCDVCNAIKPDTEFSICGGVNRANIGICKDCQRKHSFFS